MHRKKFIKTCGMGCLGMLGGLSLLQSCAGTKYLQAPIESSFLNVPLNAFKKLEKNKESFRKYIVVQNVKLKYPICIYRFSDKEYHALWMRCTHQGAELQVFGDRLQCPAHGSEFTAVGAVQNGPADANLRNFPVLVENNLLKIDLR